MATKPLTNEAIALTEKKVDMALDDIIKMSKSNNTNKGQKQWRASNKSQKFNDAAKDNALKVRRYMESQSAVRQGAYTKRRSNFQGSQFPVMTKVPHRAAAFATRPHSRPSNAGKMANMNRSRVVDPPAPDRAAHGGFPTKVPIDAMQHRENADQKQVAHGGPTQRPQTLDTMFANMKEKRERRFLQHKNNAYLRTNVMKGLPIVPWARGRFVY